MFCTAIYAFQAQSNYYYTARYGSPADIDRSSTVKIVADAAVAFGWSIGIHAGLHMFPL